LVLRGDRLDAGKTNLAAILQAEAARIEDGRDASLALRFEGTVGGDRRTGGCGKQNDRGRRDPARRAN
jgi:hypothetical protein